MPEFCVGLGGGWIGCVLASGALVGGLVLMAVLIRRTLGGGHRQDLLLVRQCVTKRVDLKRPQVVDFVLFVDRQMAAEAIAAELAAEGFETSAVQAEVQNARGGRPRGDVHSGWVVRARRTMLIEMPALKEMRARFNAAAKKAEGSYVGWQVRLQ